MNSSVASLSNTCGISQTSDWARFTTFWKPGFELGEIVTDH